MRDFPQRISAPAAPGELLKKFERPVKVPKAEHDNDPEYLAQIRELPCVCCGQEPCGEAAHLRMASAAYGKASGLGKKPSDRWALPVCPTEHRLAKDAQHNRNEAAFWESYDVNPLILACNLHAKRGDLLAMKMVVVNAIMNRKK